MPLHTQTQPAADPTADVPQAESDLTSYVASQLARGVSHNELLAALLTNFQALARVHACCTYSAGRSALTVGGRLIASAIERPTNTHLH